MCTENIDDQYADSKLKTIVHPTDTTLNMSQGTYSAAYHIACDDTCNFYSE